MKIDSSMIGMESARRYTSTTQRSTGLSLVSSADRQGRDTFGFFQDLLGAGENEQDKAGNAGNAASRKIMGGADVHQAMRSGRSMRSTREVQMLEQIRLQCVQFLIKWLCDNLGQRRGGDMGGQSDSFSMSDESGFLYAEESSAMYTDQSVTVKPANFLTMQVTNSSYYSESEDTSFATQGVVRTADGREINFNLGLSMSRNFTQYMQTNNIPKFQQMTDPLVINLDTDMVRLSDQKFEFDIDCDGVKDSISFLQGGSGFLALDKNGDGVINDGSELFGTSSGDGFADLAQYDKDGNGWIDENDEIFDKLLVWTKDENGNDAMYSLKKAGVGAICLQKADTDFSLNSLHDNQTNGMIRSTGIFLYENGNVGTMQQLDVAT